MNSETIRSPVGVGLGRLQLRLLLGTNQRVNMMRQLQAYLGNILSSVPDHNKANISRKRVIRISLLPNAYKSYIYIITYYVYMKD